jgi:hypothetical protein
MQRKACNHICIDMQGFHIDVLLCNCLIQWWKLDSTNCNFGPGQFQA